MFKNAKEIKGSKYVKLLVFVAFMGSNRIEKV